MLKLKKKAVVKEHEKLVDLLSDAGKAMTSVKKTAKKRYRVPPDKIKQLAEKGKKLVSEAADQKKELHGYRLQKPSKCQRGCGCGGAGVKSTVTSKSSSKSK